MRKIVSKERQKTSESFDLEECRNIAIAFRKAQNNGGIFYALHVLFQTMLSALTDF